MTDIAKLVERLRSGEPCRPHDDLCRSMDTRSGCICAEAADTIEALQSALQRAVIGERGQRHEIS